jgi:hypothetical protein
MTFSDISSFEKTEDYLPILTAIIIVDVIGIILSYANIISSDFLRIWYKKFQLSAVLADVLIIFIVFIIARYIYNYIFEEYSIINFIILMLILQITHDILFYLMITSIKKGSNKMIDVFKYYADEMSYYAIIGDSIMIIASVLIASYLASLDVNTNIIILIVILYLLQFILYNY